MPSILSKMAPVANNNNNNNNNTNNIRRTGTVPKTKTSKKNSVPQEMVVPTRRDLQQQINVCIRLCFLLIKNFFNVHNAIEKFTRSIVRIYFWCSLNFLLCFSCIGRRRCRLKIKKTRIRVDFSSKSRTSLNIIFSLTEIVFLKLTTVFDRYKFYNICCIYFFPNNFLFHFSRLSLCVFAPGTCWLDCFNC